MWQESAGGKKGAGEKRSQWKGDFFCGQGAEPGDRGEVAKSKGQWEERRNTKKPGKGGWEEFEKFYGEGGKAVMCPNCDRPVEGIGRRQIREGGDLCAQRVAEEGTAQTAEGIEGGQLDKRVRMERVETRNTK